ncbi:hypothetical protein EU538_09605 [Candidatus Thorarchaeota archaeon]|nr:MAG: hypothetical protein EU538_09605 [Candidatus Thorarchaeota archaeon]
MSGKKDKEGGEAALTLKERILGELQSDELEIKKREVHVMTRLSADIVDIIDTLVELEVFRSRSDAVSAYVESAIASQMDMYEDVRELGKQLDEMREKAKRMAFAAIQDRDE